MTKYKPKAGDICEWNSRWRVKTQTETGQVMIISPEPDLSGSYLAMDEEDLQTNNIPWKCSLSDLTLVYRPCQRKK